MPGDPAFPKASPGRPPRATGPVSFSRDSILCRKGASLASKPTRRKAAGRTATRSARAKSRAVVRDKAAAPDKGERAGKLTLTRGDETFTFSERLPAAAARGRGVPVHDHPAAGRPPAVHQRRREGGRARDRVLFVTAQKRGDVADPQHQELFETGTIVRVLQLFRLPDGSMRVLVEGLTRAVAKRFQWSNDFYTVTAALYPDEIAVGPEIEVLQRNTLQMFQDYVHLRRIPDEVLATTASIADRRSSYTIASHLQVKVPAKQRLLEAPGTVARLHLLAETLASDSRSCASSARSKAGALAGAQEPEGVLPPRAAQGDPQGARPAGRRRRLERSRGARDRDPQGEDAEG